jgi:hypothetical protein
MAHELNKRYIACEESQRNAEKQNAVEEDGDPYAFVPAHSEQSVTYTYASNYEVSHCHHPRMTRY